MKETKSPLYLATYLTVRWALRVFFAKIDIRRGHVMPPRGPVVLVANHPNSIMDALVLGAVLRRKVNYIAHAGLFRNAVFRWFLRSCGVIPVYRRDEAADKMEQNASMFRECTAALEKGEVIGIFPEGISDMRRKVKQIKTGAARIVLESERKHEYRLGVCLIPVGLHFFSRSRFRSRVLVNFGDPIPLDACFARYRKDEVAGVRSLTETIQQALRQLTVDIRDEELENFIQAIELIYKDELRTISSRSRKVRDKAYREQFEISKAIAECVQYYQERQPARVAEFQEQVNAYLRKLHRLKLRDAMLRKSSRREVDLRRLFTAYGYAAAGLPFAVFGMINNYLPYRIAEFCGKHFLYERTKILTALLLGGGLAFATFYALQTFLVFTFFGSVWATVYFIALPVSGLFALNYIVFLRRQKERISFSFYLFTSKHVFSRMRRERKQIITYLDRIRDEYLQLTARSAESLEG